jgi:23S rRNA (adenine2503-C2)-methyltransferase
MTRVSPAFALQASPVPVLSASAPPSSSPPLLPLQGLVPEALVRALPLVTLAEARKIVGAVHRDLPLDRIAGVRRVVMDELHARTFVPTLEVVRTEASKVDPFVKLALRTHDGHVVETVRIPLEKPGRFSVCVSSQVGCALGCTFCATGRMGLTRNLEPWEIVEQVRLVKRGLAGQTFPAGDENGVPGRVHGVVFQGMGEPMANLDRVLQALEVLREPAALAIDARNVTVSTSGLPTGILRLAKEAPKVRLALSLGTVVPGERKRLLPIDNAHPLEEVLAAAAVHAQSTGLAPLWAVTLLAGVNDEERHAHALAARLLRFAAETGVRPRLSVIPYNVIGDDDPYARTPEAREDAFREAMARAGAPTHKRYSGGGDVQAACGQLAGRGDA